MSNLSFNKDKNMKSNLWPRANDYHPVGYGLKLILILLICASVSRPGLGKSYVSCISLCMFFSLCWLFIGAYESSVGSRPSVRAIFRGGAVFSPSAWSCSRFLAAFWWNKRWTPWANKALLKSEIKEFKLGTSHLFVPLLMKISQQDVCLLCDDDWKKTEQ